MKEVEEGGARGGKGAEAGFGGGLIGSVLVVCGSIVVSITSGGGLRSDPFVLEGGRAGRTEEGTGAEGPDRGSDFTSDCIEYDLKSFFSPRTGERGGGVRGGAKVFERGGKPTNGLAILRGGKTFEFKPLAEVALLGDRGLRRGRGLRGRIGRGGRAAGTGGFFQE